MLVVLVIAVCGMAMLALVSRPIVTPPVSLDLRWNGTVTNATAWPGTALRLPEPVLPPAVVIAPRHVTPYVTSAMPLYTKDAADTMDTDMFLHYYDGTIRRRDNLTQCVPADLCRQLGLGGQAAWRRAWPDVCGARNTAWPGVVCTDFTHVDATCPRNHLSVWAQCPDVDLACPRVAPFQPLSQHQLADLSTAPVAMSEPRGNWTAADVTHLQMRLYNFPQWLGPDDVYVTSIHGADLINGTYGGGALSYPDGVPLWGVDARCVCLPLSYRPTSLDLMATGVRLSRHAGDDWRPVAANLSWHTSTCPCTCSELDTPTTTTTTTTSTIATTTSPSTTEPSAPPVTCTVQQLPGTLRLVSAVYQKTIFILRWSGETVSKSFMGEVDDRVMNQAMATTSASGVTHVGSSPLFSSSTGDPGQDISDAVLHSADWFAEGYTTLMHDTGSDRFCIDVDSLELTQINCTAEPTDGWDRVYISSRNHRLDPPQSQDTNGKYAFINLAAQSMYVAALRGPINSNYSRLRWPGDGHAFPPALPIGDYMIGSRIVGLLAGHRWVLNITRVDPQWHALDGYDILVRAPAASEYFGCGLDCPDSDYWVGQKFVGRATSIFSDTFAYAFSANCRGLEGRALPSDGTTPSLVQQLLHGNISAECSDIGCSVHEFES